MKKGRMTGKKSQEKKEKENHSFYIFETSAHRLRRLYWYQNLRFVGCPESLQSPALQAYLWNRWRRIHCTAVNIFQKVVLYRSCNPPQAPMLNLRLITCQEANQPRSQMTRQWGFDSREMTNTLDGESYSSGRGKRGL